MNFSGHFKKIDWLLVIYSILLAGMGLISIYSSSLGERDFLNFEKQVIFLGVSFVLMILFSFIDWRILKNNSYLILILYIVCILGLAGLFAFPAIKGVKSWYKVGPLFIDPIEFTKIALIILLAKYFSTRHVEMYSLKHIIFSGIYFIIPAGLIFFQPNLGSAMVLFFLWLIILIFSGIKLRHFLILCLVLILISGFSWTFLLKNYQKERITGFLSPQLEPLGINWNQQQAKIAIGAGGFLGKGIGKGSQTQYGFLPVPQNDFIFASLAEETGLVGIGILFLLFLALVWRITKIAISASNNFIRIFASGMVALLISQFCINIGMNLGLLPIIGISLPLVSYGGSGLITLFIGLGILQSMKTS